MNDTPLLDPRFTPPAIERDARLSRLLLEAPAIEAVGVPEETDYISGQSELTFTGGSSRTVFEVWPSEHSARGPAFTAADHSEAPQLLHPESEAHRAARLRVLVLSRSWARSTLSPEDEARLTLLTERLRALIPAVSESQLDALEQAQRALASAAELELDIKGRFGI